MQKGLSPGAVNVSLSSIEEKVSAAREFGFDSVEFDAANLADRIDIEGVDAIKSIMGGVQCASIGLSTEWRGDKAKFEESLLQLPRQAKAAQAIGCTRAATWILPGSNDMDLAENRAFHVERFTPIARVLADFGMSVGLEYIGPKTLRDQFKYPFIYQSGPMLEMAHEIGPNCGLLLDAWHWYTAGETKADILKMSNSDVVYVHVNDAPAGVSIDEQVDNVRCLPGETGVIDIASFLQALQEIGYDGPIVAEPFKKELADLPSNAERLKVVSASLDKIISQAGL